MEVVDGIARMQAMHPSLLPWHQLLVFLVPSHERSQELSIIKAGSKFTETQD
jgi:hypothetical protein